MNIPIQNIYYLLCYSWDKLEEKEFLNISGEETTELIDLFAKVLVNGAAYIFKRGLDRSYIDHEELFSGIKGKLVIEPTLKTNALSTKRTVCAFDEFSYNILHNRILKTTLMRLLRIRELDPVIRSEIKKLIIKLPPIDEITLNPRIFMQVRLNKQNCFYDFVLKICEIIFSSTFVDEKSGEVKFRDFIRDEQRMRMLFEAFIRNFYKRELSGFHVGREDIYWNFTPLSENAEHFLPIMQTDITLQSATLKIIIDAKFTGETLRSRFDAEKLRSENLYQLFSYIKNAETKDHLGPACEGILLYPSVDRTVKLDYCYQEHKIKIRTIDLNQHWRAIERDLKALIE